MRLGRVLPALLAPVAALSATVLAAGPAGAAEHRPVRTLALFDHAAGETPENLVLLGRRVVVSLAFASTVVVLDADGSRRQSVHVQTAGGFIAGLAIDARRHALAISVSSPDAAVAGLYEAPVDRGRIGTPARLAALPAGAFPNGLAFDAGGDLYAADSALGTVWRVEAGAGPGSAAEAWVQDPLLEPGPAGLPGANGIKYRDGALYVSNTGRHTLPSIPLGGPGVGTSLRPGDEPVRVLAGPADGVHNPSAVVPTRGRLYVTNAAFDGPTPPPSVQILAGASTGRKG